MPVDLGLPIVEVRNYGDGLQIPPIVEASAPRVVAAKNPPLGAPSPKVAPFGAQRPEIARPLTGFGAPSGPSFPMIRMPR
jgi:hypothetical protein